MKNTLTFAIIAILSAISAQARIGETTAEITARYGDGHKSADRLKGAETFKYKKNSYTVEVVISNGKSIWEIFHRDDKDITDDDIKDILKLNGEKHSWRLNKKDNKWVRADKKLEAFREPGHHQFLFIKDIAAVTAITGSSKASVDGF